MIMPDRANNPRRDTLLKKAVVQDTKYGGNRVPYYLVHPPPTHLRTRHQIRPRCPLKGVEHLGEGLDWKGSDHRSLPSNAPVVEVEAVDS